MVKVHTAREIQRPARPHFGDGRQPDIQFDGHANRQIGGGCRDGQKAAGVTRQQTGSGTWQLFCYDPNGAKVELDFDATERL